MVRLAGFLLLMILAASSAAQSTRDYSLDRKGLTAGLSRGSLRLRERTGVATISFIEADLMMPLISATVVPSPRGPHGPSPLEEIATAGSGLAAVGLDPSTGEAPLLMLGGLILSDGRVYSWPADPGRAILILPEGGFLVEDIVPQPGVVAVDDGTSFTLASINGRLPRGGAEASVYTGELRRDRPPVLGWGAGLQAARLEPVERGADPHALFLGTGGGRGFRVTGVEPASRVESGPGGVVLLVDGSGNVPVPGAVVTVTAGLGFKERFARAVLPLGRQVLERGEYTSRLAGGEIVREAVALNPLSRRLLVVGPADGATAASGVRLDGLRRYLEKAGYTDVYLLDGIRPKLLVDVRDARNDRQNALAAVRLALVFTGRAASLADVSGGEFLPVRGVVIQGTRRESASNLAGALRDRRYLPEPALDQFWASDIERAALGSGVDGPNVLRLALPRVMPVASIELIHSEAVGFSPAFNLRSFRLYGRGKRESPWRELAVVNHDAPVARERIAFAGSPELSEIRLEVLEPSFLEGATVARMAELLVWSPEPEVKGRN